MAMAEFRVKEYKPLQFFSVDYLCKLLIALAFLCFTLILQYYTTEHIAYFFYFVFHTPMNFKLLYLDRWL